ncbi:MAG TPA: ABC transporter permease [Gemmatimonadaceae bacterium]|jgi:predicted permease
MWNPNRTRPDGVRRTFSLPSSRERMMRDAEEEMQLHIEMWKQELRSRGMSDADADTEAWRRFGDARVYREHSARRAVRTTRLESAANWLAEWTQDIRFAARHFRKSPLFTAIAVLTLALGIGANTAIFSVVHHLLIAPLPYPNGDRVVALKATGTHPSASFAGLASMTADAPVNPPAQIVRAWKDRARSLDMIAGAEQVFLSLDGDGQQDTVSHVFITANFLPMLGARPALGRTFRADEELEPKRNVAMISYGWWQRAFGGRRDALGETMDYEGKPYTIIGVMPPDMSLPMVARNVDGFDNQSADMWLPASLDSVSIAYGRLAVGVDAHRASAELQNIATAAGPLVPRARERFRLGLDSMRVRAMRAQDFLAPREVLTVEVLFVAVGALLLIACANVANLLLVRSWTRRREFAVRLGLGAGRARLIRLALTESVMLATLGGALGMLVAWQSLRLIVGLRPLSLDSLSSVQISPVVLFWTAAISIGTGVLFGSVAAFFVGSQNVADVLRNEVRTSSGGHVARGVRATLIVGQIALSFALLVGTGLLIRSFFALQERAIGFDPRRLASVDILSPLAARRSGRGGDIRRQVVEQLRHTRGVIDASIGTLPTAGYRIPGNLSVATDAGEHDIGVPVYTTTWIDKEYFHTAGIAISAGRLPVPGSTDEVVMPGAMPLPPGLVPVGPGRPARDKFRSLSQEIVVNRTLARRIAPNGNVVGTRIRVSGGQLGPMQQDNDWSTIVGVSDDVHLPGAHGDLNDYQIYTLPLGRMPEPTFVVRFSSLPTNVESELRNAIHAVAPTIVVRRGRLAEDYVRDALAPTRFTLALLGAFSFIALVLSVVGLYGSIAYTVSQRTREIGIRIALGATAQSVTSLVLQDGLRLLAIGLVVGLATALASTRALASLLYAVHTSDPATFVAIGGIVAGVAVIASYVPARRAARIDPIDALRTD